LQSNTAGRRRSPREGGSGTTRAGIDEEPARLGRPRRGRDDGDRADESAVTLGEPEAFAGRTGAHDFGMRIKGTRLFRLRMKENRCVPFTAVKRAADRPSLFDGLTGEA